MPKFDFAINNIKEGGLAGFTGGRSVADMRPYLVPTGKFVVNAETGLPEPEFVACVDRPVLVNGEIKYKPQKLQANAAATLRKDEWIYFDKAIQAIYERPRVGIDDLINNGLTFDFNGYGSTVLQYEDISDTSGVRLDMEPDVNGETENIQYNLRSLPLPLFHAEFSVGDRYLQMTRNVGQPIDTTVAEKKAKDMMEGAEYLLFNGVVEGSSSAFSYAGATIYGYLNWPSAVSVAFSNAAWDNSAVTGEDVLKDVQSAINSLMSNRRYGPYMIYIPQVFWAKVTSDFKSASDKTTLQRIKELSPQIKDVKVSEFIGVKKVVVVNMTPDTIRLVRGMALTTVQWQANPYGRHHFKLLMIQVPQLRTDGADRSGVAIIQ